MLRDYNYKNKQVDRNFVDIVLDILLMNDNLNLNRTKFVSDCYSGYGYYNYMERFQIYMIVVLG